MSQTREAAAKALMQILDQGQMSHLVIRKTVDEEAWQEADRAFFTRLTEGTLEKLLVIDPILNEYSSTPVRKMKPFIRELLRSSVYQLLFMDSVPDRAVVNEAVKLAEKKGFRGLKGYVNAVLREVARKRDEGFFQDSKAEEVLPAWLKDHFEKTCGAEKTAKILASLQEREPLTVHRHRSRASREEVLSSLREQGVTASPGRYLKDEALILPAGAALGKLNAFLKGWIQPQDESSQLAILAAGIREGDRVLDVCAAPGGKTLFAADRVGAKGQVVACDISEKKTSLIKENAARAGFAQIIPQVWDATVRKETRVGAFDVVLADLPCSGLGIIGRKKDIRYKMTPEQMDELSFLQRKILDTVWEYVKKDGVLLYSTCTINPKENEENRAYVLEHYPFVPVDLSGREEFAAFAGEESLKEGYLQLLPGVHGCDGFFFSVMKRYE
ncbi:MAG: 16S rRNA (cytosine(967)-C(5))-methyltransferase RsmB [Lachnospiraceae bacterium]|nr:16S rRNA (cytosine(967)-C(5))-methyltransferase RsmB [Lachnospiraceae bacterium]